MTQERPLHLLIETGNLDKKDITEILNNIKHLDVKPFKKDDMLKITFPIRTAITLTLQDFILILGKSTHRLVHAYLDDNETLCFKLSDKKYDIRSTPKPKEEKKDGKEQE